MQLSIIFVNYKTKEMTINAIKSVMEKTKDLEYEIFVVDNDSQDGSIEVIQAKFNGLDVTNEPNLITSQIDAPPIYIIKNDRNAGFGAANNLAIKKARGKYILCLNTDTLLINNALKIMYDFMEKEENKRVGVCGGYMVDTQNRPAMCGGHLPSLGGVLFKTGLRKIFKNFYKNFSIVLYSDDEKYVQNIEYIIGADIFFRKSVLDEVGIFDENYFMYCEEADLCKRIKDAGYKIKFLEEAKIMHLEQGSTNDKIEARKRAKTSEFIYFNKHKKNQVWLIKLIYLFIFFIDGYIFGNINSRKLFSFVRTL